MKVKKFFLGMLISFKNFICFLSILFSFESFKMKTPFGIVMGIMLLSIGLLLLPYFNKFLNKININLTKWQKTFIFISTIYVAPLSISLDETNYLRCLFSFLLLLLVWVITIIYSKYKKNKN